MRSKIKQVKYIQRYHIFFHLKEINNFIICFDIISLERFSHVANLLIASVKL